jgi:phosphoribosylanthranilate isomerase
MKTGRTRIKICGMTRERETDHAIACGVDALGFIFFKKSPRNIEPEKARRIISSFPPFIDAVGVFVNEEAEVVNQIANYCGLTVVQLHGAESPEFCREIRCRIVKSFQLKPEFSPENFSLYQDVVSGFLFDTYSKKMAGGTGKTFDWSILERFNPQKPVILAGGITPENAAEAIRQVRPYGIDANSGLEITPGRKDPDKISRFINQVIKADFSA